MRTLGLILGLSAIGALTGCPDNDKVSWPGQRQSPSPEVDAAAGARGEVIEGAPASEPNAALTTQYLGNAFVGAARAHNALVQGNVRAARNEVWAIRRQLRLATQWATLDQQREINRLEGHVIEFEAQLADETSNPQAESAELLRTFLTSYDTVAAGEGGGAGAAGDRREARNERRPPEVPPATMEMPATEGERVQ